MLRHKGAGSAMSPVSHAVRSMGQADYHRRPESLLRDLGEPAQSPGQSSKIYVHVTTKSHALG